MSPRIRTWRRRSAAGRLAGRRSRFKGAERAGHLEGLEAGVGSFRARVRPTKEGIRLLLLLAVMGFAAFNTRNNLLYLMFSLGLATIGLSLFGGWLSLRRLAPASGGVSDLYARTPSAERFRLENRSRWLDAYAVEVEEIDFPGRPPRATLAHLAPGGRDDFALHKSYPRRGVFASRGLRLSTRFPFGLFRVRREVALARRLLVFPAIRKTDISFVFQSRDGATPHQQRRGETEELLRIREYATGDNLHHVHWKATAKSGRIMVRELASEQQRRFCILFDNRRPESPVHDVVERWEALVETAASLAVHLGSHQLAFRFVSADARFGPSHAPEHLRGVLTYLAEVTLSARPVLDVLDWARLALRDDEIVLLLSLRGSEWREAAAPNLFHIDAGVSMPAAPALGEKAS